jgi:hypothetical protein
MKETEEDSAGRTAHHAAAGQPLVVRVSADDFQCEVLQKLARLEAKMDMLVGGSQPGRITLFENRLTAVERNDVRRGVYDRLLNALIASVVSAVIAMHDRFLK